MHFRHPHTMERKWIYPLAVGSVVSLFLLFLATLTSPDGTPLIPLYRYYAYAPASVFVEHKLHAIPVSTLPPPPRFAYLIYGSKHDGAMLKRTLLALYHPHNRRRETGLFWATVKEVTGAGRCEAVLRWAIFFSSVFHRLLLIFYCRQLSFSFLFTLDRISSLPQDTIEKILTLMPLRDALRTSILSRKWRYCWTSMPKLEFDDNLVDVSFDNEKYKKYKLVNAIFRVLLLHRGPILELSIHVGDIDIGNEIDLIILHLSRSNNIKKFIFGIWWDNISRYKLPGVFFSLQGLEHLVLTFCVFELPLTFNGFSMLKSLRFTNVNLTAKMLQRFLTKCPLLEEFTLVGPQEEDFVGGNKCTFVELFRCLPLVQVLDISSFYVKYFAAGGMPQKLSTSLVHLRILVLDVCFQRPDEFLSVLCVIRSSPNLEKIKMMMLHAYEKISYNLLDLQDYSGCLNLDHLKELEIRSFHNYVYEMEFVKLIVAGSPVLKKAQIELTTHVSIDEENKMLRILLQTPFLRASPSAIFIIKRPKI